MQWVINWFVMDYVLNNCFAMGHAMGCDANDCLVLIREVHTRRSKDEAHVLTCASDVAFEPHLPKLSTSLSNH